MSKILVGVNAYPKQPFISHKPLIAVLNEAAIEAENDAAIAAAFAEQMAERELLPYNLQDLRHTLRILRRSETRRLDLNEWDSLISDMGLREYKTKGEIQEETEGVYLLDFKQNFQDLNTWEVVGEVTLEHNDWLMIYGGKRVGE
ncbi:unnamed protein product [Arabidopsis lyrata]|uniref:Predicted protein n=1 Tax=Arabidopsis lyrata subsp. lyrata TaxID=81972 RepID=D7KLP3_ARALL|nr:predicted protein [Arabidopsis lyrata subsp. lyrata]CAH8253190.1 unnamed protein product [Arabidopsis lyrata]